MRIISIGMIMNAPERPDSCNSVLVQKNTDLFDRDYNIYNENLFNYALCTERKRTERSQRPFLLLLLNIERLLQEENAKGAVKDMLSVLRKSLRNIDLCGWYKYNSVIGVLFPELGTQNTHAALEAIGLKIHGDLLRNFPLGIVNKMDIRFSFFPEKLDEVTTAGLANKMFYPDISRERKGKRAALFVKRIIDIMGSIFCMFLYSPFFLTIPVLIKLTSPGPVLFRQERVGLFGQKFIFLKFRSMHVNNNDSLHREFVRQLITGNKGREAEGSGEDALYKIKDDPRVTPLGKILRKTSLDEIPQFLNVLKGEMSLVGPRPAIQYELEDYDIWHRHRLLHVKPGITGLWQVMGRSSTNFDEMVRLDLKYIREWSPWLDLKILLMTPMAVLRGKGAY
ncbi:MAG TPA: sugar transferase [Geobacteraceae bacterium]|nr:sugar transferase [Geobacteraceae bacterium]